METYEFRILTLQVQELVRGGRTSHWQCSRAGKLGDETCLAGVLNQYGKDGWHVATRVSDSHFGNSILLQRRKSDAPAAPVEPKTVQKTQVPEPPSAEREELKVIADRLNQATENLVLGLVKAGQMDRTASQQPVTFHMDRTLEATLRDLASTLQTVSFRLSQFQTPEIPVSCGETQRKPFWSDWVQRVLPSLTWSTR